MGNPYLNSDESLVLSTHNIAIDSIPSEAILTNQRIILVDSRSVHFAPRDIPLGAIETVLNGNHENNVPYIALSFVVSNGGTQTVELTFSQRASEKREQECNNWVAKLKEFVASARKSAQASGIYPTADEPKDIAPEQGASGEELAGNISAEIQSPRKWAPIKPARTKKVPLSARFNTSGRTSRLPVVIAIVAIIFVVVVIAGGMFFYSNNLSGKTTTPSLTPVVTQTAIPTPIPTTMLPVSTTAPVMTLTVTPVPAETSGVITPSTGVWIRVTYSGNFSGSVGTSGRMTPVSGSGDRFYQIPTIDDIVEASIQKDDLSGNLLTVVLYHNGMVAGKDTTSAPSGSVDLHIDLKQP